MIVRAPHLQDEALFECYYAERRGEALDPPSAEHLADCEACARRYFDIGTFLTTVRENADADVSALFPPERLRAQQQEIARRLELVGRAARVITFPGRVPTQTLQRPSATRASRWIAAAAAAGLFVGVAAGTVLNFGPRFDFARRDHRGAVTIAARQGALSPSMPTRIAPASVEPAVVDMDEMFMSDLDSVLDRPHTSELVAFDALTPHVREIRDSVR